MTRRTWPIFSSFLLAALAPLPALAAIIVSVGNGDTLCVRDGGVTRTIRVACIDAPEMAQSPHGQQARDALQALAPVGSDVTLKVQTTDRYGSTVTEVITRSGRNAGLHLVSRGHAFAYRRYLDQCDAPAYLDAEQIAQRYHLGVWKRSDGITRPWDWRAARRGRGTTATGSGSKPSWRAPAPVLIDRPSTPTAVTGRSGGTVSSAGSRRRWRCRDVGSWERAQQLLREGHTYLDGDRDGEACEALR